MILFGKKLLEEIWIGPSRSNCAADFSSTVLLSGGMPPSHTRLHTLPADCLNLARCLASGSMWMLPSAVLMRCSSTCERTAIFHHRSRRAANRLGSLAVLQGIVSSQSCGHDFTPRVGTLLIELA